MEGRHVLDPVAIDLSTEIGAGFQHLRQSSAGEQLLDVLDSYAGITVALDHHTRGGPTAPELADLVRVRNCTQHRMLSQMQDPVDLSNPEQCVHHAIILSTLIFSDMVIFCLPPTQRVKPRLAQMLRQTLETCRLLSFWDVRSQVLLWCLTMGAIASNFTSNRPWYIDQLLLQTSSMHIREWYVLDAICSRFLWWKPVCSEPLGWVWSQMISPSAVDVTRRSQDEDCV